MRKHRLLILLLLVVLLAACIPQAMPTEIIIPTPTPVPFKFGPQTADEAQELLTQAEKTVLEVGHYADYRSQVYLVAEYAAWDALHRFPDDLRAATWKWKFAYYAALIGDSEAANGTYMDLITNALNEKKVTVADLPLWFQSGESSKDDSLTPPFIMTVINFSGKQEDQKYLIRLGSKYSDVASCYLLDNILSKYSISVIYDGFLDGHSLMNRNGLDCQLKDLTNDGTEDVIVTNYYFTHDNSSNRTQIFDVTTLPPRPLPFSNFIYRDRYKTWNVEDYPVVNGKSQIKTTDDFYRCSARITQTFEWNGVEFSSVDASAQIDKENAPLKECGYQFFSKTENLSVETRVRILEEAIKFYEPVAADDEEMQILDKLRVQKGLVYLFENQPNQVRQVFQEILQDPYQKDGIWQKPIQDFLDVYKVQSDIYRACSELTPCDPYVAKARGSDLSCVKVSTCNEEALNYLIKNDFSTIPVDELSSNLNKAGLDFAFNEYIDFNQDGKKELLFTISSPQKDYYSTWVAAEYLGKINLFHVSDSTTAVPEYKVTTPDQNRVFATFSIGSVLIWTRQQMGDEQTLNHISVSTMHDVKFADVIADAKTLKKLRAQIFKGVDFRNTYIEFLEIKNRNEVCPFSTPGDWTTDYYDCVSYYYDLGFVSELAGDEQTAREMYTTIVKQYPDHPLALLARNKLGK